MSEPGSAEVVSSSETEANLAAIPEKPQIVQREAETPRHDSSEELAVARQRLQQVQQADEMQEVEEQIQAAHEKKPWIVIRIIHKLLRFLGIYSKKEN